MVPPHPDRTDRNRSVIAAAESGRSYASIAAEYGISVGRIVQLVAKARRHRHVAATQLLGRQLGIAPSDVPRVAAWFYEHADIWRFPLARPHGTPPTPGPCIAPAPVRIPRHVYRESHHTYRVSNHPGRAPLCVCGLPEAAHG